MHFRYRRKIWLTEFAKARTAGIESVLEHIDKYLPLLEESEIIHRYNDLRRGPVFLYKYKIYKTRLTSSNHFYTDIHGIRAAMTTGIIRDLMDGT